MNASDPLFEFSQVFCGNRDCVLHVSPGDPEVIGHGNWAVLPSGIVVGRGRYDGRLLCDRCGRDTLHRTLGSFTAGEAPADTDDCRVLNGERVP